MAETAADLLPQYKRVTELVIAHFQEPTWTPAFAVAFVCGVEAIKGCREIPKRAMQIRRPSKRATPLQLLHARELLERWRECYTDPEEPDKPPPSKTTPMDFFYWCEVDCEQAEWKPDLLDHILGLIYAPRAGRPLPPVSMYFLEAAKALERYQRLELEGTLSAARLAASTAASGVGKRVTVRRTGKYGKVCPLEAEIVEARSLTPIHQRMDGGAVLAVMLRFAHDGAHPKIERSTPERLLYLKNGVETPYTQRALQQFINERPLGPDGEPLESGAG